MSASQLSKTLIVLAGPTAVGKTAWSVRIAQALGIEILSADSRQFYREMRIGTAPPDPDELAVVKHHFILDRSVTEPLDAGTYEREALAVLGRLFETHDQALCVGGSGLYLKALTDGFDALPESDEDLRNELRSRLATEGLPALAEELARLDPLTAARTDLQNPQRVVRALEICLLSGQKASELRQGTESVRPFSILKICLVDDRARLYERINGRVDRMIEEGLVEEALRLYSLRHLPPLQTVGYRELFEYLEGLTDLPSAIENIKMNTRRYAKRQLTWMRKQPGYAWFMLDEADNILPHIKIMLGLP